MCRRLTLSLYLLVWRARVISVPMIREAVWEEPMRAQPAGVGANTPSKLVYVRANPFSDALTGRDRLPIS